MHGKTVPMSTRLALIVAHLFILNNQLLSDAQCARKSICINCRLLHINDEKHENKKEKQQWQHFMRLKSIAVIIRHLLICKRSTAHLKRRIFHLTGKSDAGNVLPVQTIRSSMCMLSLGMLDEASRLSMSWVTRPMKMKMKTNNPGWGGKRQGAGRPKQYIHKKIPLRHGAGIEFTEHYYLSPEYPNDPTHIVLAQNDDEGYGVYIDEVWF